MDLFSSASLGLPFLFAIVFLLSVYWLYTKNNSCLPPGPTPVPLLGNLYLLYGQSMSAMYTGLVKKYGDIFTFYIGQRRTVFLNSYDVIRDACLVNGEVFSGRPELATSLVFPRKSGILLSEGEGWRFHRRFSLKHLKDFGFGKRSFEPAINKEREHFLEAVRNENGEAFDIRLLLDNAVSNLICDLTFNKRYDYGDQEFQQFAKHLTQDLNSNPLLSNMLLYLRFIPGIVRQKIKGLLYVKNLCKRFIREHEDTYDADNLRDLIDTYIKEKHNVGFTNGGGEDIDYLSEINIIKTIFDIFVAGTETTSTALRWSLLFMMKHDDVQSKVRSEINMVVGSGRRPQLADRGHLHYTEAVITEVLRLANVVRGGVRRTLSDTVFRGYEIPAGTIVIPNQTAVHMDEKTFPEPHSFRPERFLDEHGLFNKEMADKTIPFGIGKRVCLGESLAKMEMFLFFTAMIQQFEFTPPDGVLPEVEEPFIERLVNAPPDYKLCALPC